MQDGILHLNERSCLGYASENILREAEFMKSKIALTVITIIEIIIIVVSLVSGLYAEGALSTYPVYET